MKRSLRAAIVGLVVGVVALGSALAGIVVVPELGPESPLPSVPPVLRASSAQTASVDAELSPEEVGDVATSDVAVPNGGRLAAGTFKVGAARVSISPSPTHFGGQTWQTDGCTSIEDGHVDEDHALPDIDPSDPITSLDDIRSWPATGPDCVYLGGFGIGPARYARSVGAGGVWIRALAISNGEDTFIYGIADTVGWFARYDPTICSDCGIRDVRDRLAGDLGIDVGNIVIGSTHTHAGADTYGGWGGIPKWYRNQIRDSAIAAAKQAVANMREANITVGEIEQRDRNNERRDTYYSTVDTGAPWLQATTPSTTREECSPATDHRGQGKKPTPTPACKTVVVPGEVIATMGAFAAHPTIVGGPFLHADWPGGAAREFEADHGGVGLMFEGGLGNASVSEVGGADDEEKAEKTGQAIANAITGSIAMGGEQLTSNELRSSVQDISHPVSTNLGLVTLASVGFFDREFLPTGPGAGAPGAYHWSKSGELSTADDNDAAPQPGSLRGCTSTGPSLRTTAGAHRIGSMLLAFTPGEIFGTLAEVIKERADDNTVAMVLGQSNDALGYIIQSFEFDTQGNALTEYGTQTGEYEEVFAVDRCFGDHVLETALESTRELGFGG